MFRFLRRALEVFSIFVLGGIGASAVTLDTTTFSIFIPANQGSLSGETFTGSLTWDTSNPADINPPNFNFSTTFPTFVTGELTGAGASLNEDYPIVLDYRPTGQPNYFFLSDIVLNAGKDGTGNFVYGVQSVNGLVQSGSGTVTFAPLGDPQGSVPEPGSILLIGTGLLGIVQAIRRQRTK